MARAIGARERAGPASARQQHLRWHGVLEVVTNRHRWCHRLDRRRLQCRWLDHEQQPRPSVVPTLRCRHSAGRPPPPRCAWAPVAGRTAGHRAAAEDSGGGCRRLSPWRMQQAGGDRGGSGQAVPQQADQGTPCAAAQGAHPRPRRTRGAAPGGVEIDLPGGGAIEGSGRLRKKNL
jgi:hypothetical protein